MDGYNIIVISGIDGSFMEYDSTIEKILNCRNCVKISYDRSLTFIQNIEFMRKIIDKINMKCVIVGWSIGAVASAFLADCTNVTSVVLINPFFRRSDILKRRNISCEEEVTILSTKKQAVKYTIITGMLDDKIPYNESEKIVKYYNLNSDEIIYVSEARHNISSFPKGLLAKIINIHTL